MEDRIEDKVSTWDLNGREITDIERFPSFPRDDEELMAKCRQCVKKGALFEVNSEFMIGFVKFPGEDDPDQSITHQTVCDGGRDHPDRCAIKVVQYQGPESDEVMSETYLDTEYERRLLEKSNSNSSANTAGDSESKFRSFIRRLFGRKAT